MSAKNILIDCRRCRAQAQRFFCGASLTELDEGPNKIKSVTSYPKGARLFTEGQPPGGVFVLCAGTVKLWTCSSSGRTVITRIAHAGDVLGLNAVVDGRPYGVSAEMMEPAQASFIPGEFLLQQMKEHGEVALAVAEELSKVYYTAHEQLCTLGRSHLSVKLAKLLLCWTEDAPETARDDDPMGVRLTLTHEEIGETIGATRESVSRVLSEFSKSGLLLLKRSFLCIKNRPALERIGRMSEAHRQAARPGT